MTMESSAPEMAAAAAAATHPDEMSPEESDAENPKPKEISIPVPVDAADATQSKESIASATADEVKRAVLRAGALDSVESVINRILESHKLLIAEEDAIKSLRRENDASKDKIAKLKALLGRSAKAQRESKIDAEATSKRLTDAHKEIDRLKAKIETLMHRPTHMELLADFETNFDRALVNLNSQQRLQSSTQQDSGQNTSATPSIGAVVDNSAAGYMDSMLMNELNEAKARIEKLETLNHTLVQRGALLEKSATECKQRVDTLKTQVSHLELEKRMAVMEAEQANKSLQATVASLAEMQLEVELVNKASHKANLQRTQGEQLRSQSQSDRQRVVELERQTQALKEWALASSEAKTLAQERVRVLETQLASLKDSAMDDAAALNASECVLLSQSSSFVVGAGDVGVQVVELEEDLVRNVKLSERVVLRWKFDLTTDDLDIAFSVHQSKCETAAARKRATALIQDRMVHGGAAGECDNAFVTSDRACTLSWSNVKSWIRPQTVKYTISVVTIDD